MNNFVLLLACLLCASFASAQCPDFISCPPTPDTICDLSDNDPQFWRETYWFDPVNQIADLAEAAVALEIMAFDTCGSGNPSISFLLKLDLDGDGQTETGIWSDSLNAPNRVFFNNLMADGEPRTFDERPVLPAAKFRFALNTFSVADTTFARIGWNTEAAPDIFSLPQLPAGHHEVVWTVRAPDGSAKTCSRPFWIRDCEAPIVQCISGLSVNILPTKMITLWNTDFLQYTADNYTPANLIRLGIRKKGSGTGFPLNPDGTTATNVTFTCDEIGLNEVEIWVEDRSGNTSFCETDVIVNDFFWLCNSPAIVQSCVTYFCPGFHPEHTVQAISDTPPQSWYSVVNSLGCTNLHLFPIPVSGALTVSVFDDSNDHPAITSADIHLLERHLDGTKPFDSPYQWVAADVNNDGVLDSMDLAEMELVHSWAQFDWTNNTTWRFIPKDYSFPFPNPLADSIPSSYSINLLQNPIPTAGVDFVAVKIGKLFNCSITPVIQPESADFAAVQLVPNPTSAGAFLAFELAESAKISLELFDVSGRAVFQQAHFLSAGAQKIEIPAKALPASGLYFWRLSDGRAVTMGKLFRH